MDEIRGRLLIGGMVLKDLRVTLDQGTLDSGSGWTGTLSLVPPRHEHLELGRPYRLELDDERAAQIEVLRIERVPGEYRLRAFIRGCSPLKWSPFAHEYRHESAVTLIPVSVPAEQA